MQCIASLCVTIFLSTNLRLIKGSGEVDTEFSFWKDQLEYLIAPPLKQTLQENIVASKQTVITVSSGQGCTANATYCWDIGLPQEAGDPQECFYTDNPVCRPDACPGSPFPQGSVGNPRRVLQEQQVPPTCFTASGDNSPNHLEISDTTESDCVPGDVEVGPDSTLIIQLRPDVAEHIAQPLHIMPLLDLHAHNETVSVYMQGDRVMISQPFPDSEMTTVADFRGKIRIDYRRWLPYTNGSWLSLSVLTSSNTSNSSHIAILASGTVLGQLQMDTPTSGVVVRLPLPSNSEEIGLTNMTSSLSYFLGDTRAWFLYDRILPQRWIYEQYHNRKLQLDIPVASCYCPASHPLFQDEQCKPLDFKIRTRTVPRVPVDTHHITTLRHGYTEHYWLSAPDTTSINVTINFGEEKFVFGSELQFYGPLPNQMTVYSWVNGEWRRLMDMETQCKNRVSNTAYLPQKALNEWKAAGYPDDSRFEPAEVFCTNWADHSTEVEPEVTAVSAIWVTAANFLAQRDEFRNKRFLTTSLMFEMKGLQLPDSLTSFAEYEFLAIGQVEVLGNCFCAPGTVCTKLPNSGSLDIFASSSENNDQYACLAAAPLGNRESTDVPTEGRGGGQIEGIIVGITVGVVAVIIIALVLAVLWRRRRLGDRSNIDSLGVDVKKRVRSGTFNGAFEPRYLGDPSRKSANPGNLDAELIQKVKECLITRDRLKLGNFVGKGNFGTVFSGQLQEGDKWTRVAVKTIKGESDPAMKEAFLIEATMMKDFDHVNVLGLIGVSHDEEERPLVVLPFMDHGDLRGLLQTEELRISLGDLVHFTLQISLGMDYLSRHKFVHRDLAARNCMVNSSFVLKIADFGLAHDVYEKDYYKATDKSKPLPVKWMAPESLTEGVFNKKTDVWSFGVVIWEVFAKGAAPYPGIRNYDVMDYVNKGHKLTKPAKCPSDMYEIMVLCWDLVSSHRPLFCDLSTRLISLSKKYGEERFYTKDISDNYYSGSMRDESCGDTSEYLDLV